MTEKKTNYAYRYTVKRVPDYKKLYLTEKIKNNLFMKFFNENGEEIDKILLKKEAKECFSEGNFSEVQKRQMRDRAEALNRKVDEAKMVRGNLSVFQDECLAVKNDPSWKIETGKWAKWEIGKMSWEKPIELEFLARLKALRSFQDERLSYQTGFFQKRERELIEAEIGCYDFIIKELQTEIDWRNRVKEIERGENVKK